MALVTRCPQCGAAFKVVADQLRVRNGLVRCGACQTVFDGRACLVQPEAPVVPLLTQPADETPPTPVPTPVPTPTPAPHLAPPAVPAIPEVHTPPAPVAPEVAPAVLRGRADMRRDAPEQAADDENDEFDAFDEGADAAPAPLASAAPYGRTEPQVSFPPLRAARDEAGREPRLGTPAPWDDTPARPDDAPAVMRGVARPGQVRGEPRLGAAPREPVWRDGAGEAQPQPDPDPDDDAPRWRAPLEAEPRIGAHEDDDIRAADPQDDEDESQPVVQGESRTRYSSATDSGRTPPEFLDDDRSESRRAGRRIWSLLCVLGIVALLLQLLYVYRTPIATTIAPLRPVLELACQPLGCSVGYARRIERIAIASSSLQPPSGSAGAAEEGRSQLVLNVILRNRFDKPQPWPALVLQLTDMSDTVVARKVLMPRDYLTPQQAAGPFAAAGEARISVPVQVSGLQVNGYQLDKFFP